LWETHDTSPRYGRLNIGEKCNKKDKFGSQLRTVHTWRVLTAVIMISSGQVAGTDERGNEQSGSIKCGEILD